jgi:excisionase family DNA binding protein
MSARKSPPPLEPLSPLGPPDPSIPKAAEMIGVSDRTLRRAIERGEIEGYQLFGESRVKLASLHLFLQRARSKPLKLLAPDGKRPPGRPKRSEYAPTSAE